MGKEAWQKGRNFSERGQTVLVLPPDETPELYIWPVDNCDVLAMVTSPIAPHIIKQTAHALLLSGARVVRVLLPTHKNKLVVYRRQANDA